MCLAARLLPTAPADFFLHFLVFLVVIQIFFVNNIQLHWVETHYFQ